MKCGAVHGLLNRVPQLAAQVDNAFIVMYVLQSAGVQYQAAVKGN